ncbi:MAG: hypothetical protein DIU84_02555 [Bacillota bacterium]|nr:MAG: hypothetical protein DIU84_02555 [Bacillota bacterium]
MTAGAPDRDAGYEILEHTADVGLEAYGPTQAEALRQAALGMAALVVPPDQVRPARRWQVHVSAPDPDLLLFNLLDELLYLHHVEGMLVHDVTVEAEAPGGPGGSGGAPGPGRWSARAVARGETLDPRRHRPGTEIKAVTLHGIALRPEGGRWVGRVVFDL